MPSHRLRCYHFSLRAFQAELPTLLSHAGDRRPCCCYAQAGIDASGEAVEVDLRP